MNLLSLTGGQYLKVGVRKVMRKIAINSVWSEYSFKRRKGKRPICERHNK